MTEIQKADRKARKKVILIIPLAGIIGAITMISISLNNTVIIEWLDNNTDYLLANSWAAFILILVLFSPLIILSLYIYKFSKLVIEDQRFPPLKYTVIRDTEIYTGSKAIFRARIAQLFSLLLLSSSIIIPFVIVSILKDMLASAS